MIVLVNIPRFLLRHFPIFIAGILLGLMSAGWSITTAAMIYFPKENPGYSLLIGMAFALIISISNAMIIYGRPQWVRVMVGVFVFCLVIQLSPAAYGFNPLFWLVNVVVPLLGLLVLNSNRHRRMRRKMVQVRRFRVMVRRAQAIIEEREQASHEQT
ncbi:hypothetical protein SAMN05216598_3865 [Pseudomonas asplenii]|uniref:Uncharacterized protein n=1 Tax=Pseudomonas asplenii TaxID=53407 RepID=A0A1H1XFG4_9PSED|nr:hypothetical protein [Pseudomonas asplenii]SDT07436.1 hypothetical protein SAMN05216598_3865 [Pseudomonas asplenii]